MEPEIQKWEPKGEPDFQKLTKLDKLLGKIEHDIKKRVQDQDKVAFIDTLKKTYDIYQLILGEMYFQLQVLQLEKFGDIVMKICTGQHTLLNVLLKMRTNFDFNLEKMKQKIVNLQQPKMREGSDEEYNNQLIKNKRGGDKRGYGRGNAVNNQNVKQLTDNWTSTYHDIQEGADKNKVKALKDDIDKLLQEQDEEANEIDDFLKQRKDLTQKFDASQAENNLQNIFKDLAKEKKKMDNLIKDNELDINKDMGNFDINSLNLNRQNTVQVVQQLPKPNENQRILNGVLVEVKSSSAQTLDMYNKLLQDLENVKLEATNYKKTIEQLHVNIKELGREIDIGNMNNSKLEKRIKDLSIMIEKYENNEERYRQEERKRIELAKTQIIMGTKEKEQMKQLFSENIELKLKIKNIVNVITEQERKIKQNLTKFKNYTNGMNNFTDENKKLMISKVEELFSPNLSSSLNLRELEILSRIDESLLKNKFLKDCIGDPILLLKQLKIQDQEKREQQLKPGYNADFDPNLLDANQKIVTVKVKKMVKRIDPITGKMYEEEIEVEEEMVIDTLTGNILRKREKNVEGQQQNQMADTFTNQLKGLAVGGIKFKKPEIAVKKPVSKDGNEIVEGEWFEDVNGNIVRVVRNKNGEEEYEIKEEYIDEFGIKRTQIKKVKYMKDAQGRDITVEEFVDPLTGQKMKIEKKAYKDKDGTEVLEEIITDAKGNKQIKRTRVKKDKDGNDIIEDEIIDENGQKKIIRTKIMKDKNGNDIMIQEIINPDGTRTIITEKIDANGNKIVTREIINKDGTKTIFTEQLDEQGNKIIIEEKVDKNGKKQIVSEKKIKIDANGKLQVEETNYDKNGIKLSSKNQKTVVDADGKQVHVEEFIDKDGTKKIKTKKIMKDENGNDVEVEEITNEKGEKVTIKKKRIIDENGNEVFIEETIDANGNKIVKKRIVDVNGNVQIIEEVTDAQGNKTIVSRKEIIDANGNKVIIEEVTDSKGNKTVVTKKEFTDANGNKVIIEEVTDSNGNKKVVTRKVNKDSSVEEEIFDPVTGEKRIIKRVKDESGREIVEEITIDKNGNKTIKNTVITKDQFGNTIIQESRINPATGKAVTVTKKITKDKMGREIVEETIVDQDGNVKTVKTKSYKDKDGSEVTEQTILDKDGNVKQIKTRTYKDKDGCDVTEQEIIGANGKKQKIKTKVHIDKDGNEIIEEETIDENGNKVIKKRIKRPDGTESVEEITITSDGKKTIKQINISKDGKIEETIIHPDGKIEKNFKRAGIDDKQTQTQFSKEDELQALLESMGLDPAKIQDFKNQIKNYSKLDGDDVLQLNKKAKKQHESLSVQNQNKNEESKNNALDASKGQIGSKRDANQKKNQESSSEDEDKLQVLDDETLTEEQQLELLYKQMQTKGDKLGDLQRMIRNQLGMQGDEFIKFEDFKEYLIKFKGVHSKCGENCPHLKRFYGKLGFIQNKYRRKFIKMVDTKIKVNDKKLPKPY